MKRLKTFSTISITSKVSLFERFIWNSSYLRRNILITLSGSFFHIK